ncbi:MULTISPECIES: hypothetical protein [unclassified Lentimicrobium]|uniref:hypothetical protein n=1 Tax=unclassified Lentimicrobium TaxID=2677434 RepID=UPI001551C5BE|nr:MULTISPECIES: hypothetical protein [unclassified Lentimicrobium]NPD44663.1 hypothetical protein [Lentimicrobium sp. S6]NPD85843.1 hypothetical protein [Lentimicrobium sp. L6]
MDQKKMNIKGFLSLIAIGILLLLLFYTFFIIGTIAISGMLPDNNSEPGLVSENIGFLFFGIINMSLVIGLILTSRWNGWKLALLMGTAYYGAVTFLTQIETWYFMSNVTFDPKLLPHLFIMGLPIAFIYIPLVILILGKGKNKKIAETKSLAIIPVKQWIWKLTIIAIIYILLYWSAGYFIAWQNADLRAFYGSPGDILPFWEHTAATLKSNAGLIPFQAIRAILWTLCALPIIRGSNVNKWWTAILVGLLFTIPQMSGLILENPLMPIASVRLSHILEGLSTNFIFGMIIVWLLNRRHNSINDLLGINNKNQ